MCLGKMCECACMWCKGVRDVCAKGRYVSVLVCGAGARDVCMGAYAFVWCGG